MFVTALAAVLASAVYAHGADPTAVLERRQAAMGGGAGKPMDTTVTTPASIKGYTPPASTKPEAPTNFKKGTILDLKDVKGYEEAMRFAQSPGDMVFVPSLMVAGAAAIAGTAFFL